MGKGRSMFFGLAEEESSRSEVALFVFCGRARLFFCRSEGEATVQIWRWREIHFYSNGSLVAAIRSVRRDIHILNFSIGRSVRNSDIASVVVPQYGSAELRSFSPVPFSEQEAGSSLPTGSSRAGLAVSSTNPLRRSFFYRQCSPSIVYTSPSFIPTDISMVPWAVVGRAKNTTVSR